MSIHHISAIPTKPIHAEYLRRITAYVDAHVSETIELDDLVRQTGCSRCYFARTFRAFMGFTPMRFVKLRRIEAAKRMMRESDACLSDVAADCGFASQSHLTTTFKKEVGSTPSAWRLSVKLSIPVWMTSLWVDWLAVLA